MAGRTLSVRVKRLILRLAGRVQSGSHHKDSPPPPPPPPPARRTDVAPVAASGPVPVVKMAEQEEDFSSLPITDRFVHKVRQPRAPGA
jgi:hypothetical protein